MSFAAERVLNEVKLNGDPIVRSRRAAQLVLEDNPYGLLRYEGEALPTLYSLDAAAVGRGGSDLVIYLGTFSKILSPGLRLGWAVAPRPVLEKLNLGKQGADLCSSPVTQMFVAAYFEEQDAGGGDDGGRRVRQQVRIAVCAHEGRAGERYSGRDDAFGRSIDERRAPSDDRQHHHERLAGEQQQSGHVAGAEKVGEEVRRHQREEHNDDRPRDQVSDHAAAGSIGHQWISI